MARRLQVAACQPVNRYIDYHIIDINKINNCYNNTCVSSPCDFPLEEQAIVIGLTLAEVNEMIVNCPCSCEVECGTVQPVTSEIQSGEDSEDGGAIISPVIAASNEMLEENIVDDGNDGGFSIQAVMEEYGIFIYAGVGAVVVFIGVIYVVRSYQRRNVANRDRSYSFDDYGSRTEVSGQSRSRVSFWGYN